DFEPDAVRENADFTGLFSTIADNRFARLTQSALFAGVFNRTVVGRRIKAAAERMDHLIQDGLNYSRVMRADLPLTPTDVGALLREMVETYPAFQPPLAEIEMDGHLPLVNANQAALTQCISNLLGNAVKFIAPSVTPRVRVCAETHDGRV